MLTKSRKRKTILICLLFIALMTITIGVASAQGFERWPVVTIDGVDYYMAGAPDGPNGETDVPGHSWLQTGPNRLVAKHYNTGPFGAPKWWSSDAPDGALLYIANVIIDEWTPEKAAAYAERGTVHYHEFVSVVDGTPHPSKVGWFKHTARTSFTLNGGPGAQFYHSVTPGIDYDFIPIWSKPYNP